MEEKTEGIPVVINLASLASYEGITDDPIQVVTTGTLFHKGNAKHLRYTESMEDEETGQVTESEILLVLKKDQVMMNRMGDYINTMLFQRNKHYETTYHTPFGDLPMAVYARDVRCDLGDKGGKVHLKYDLSMQGSYASTNELHLEYWMQ